MRTTVRLNDSLLRRAKRYAVEHRQTLTSLLEESLQERLARAEAVEKPIAPPRLPTYKGKGLRRGVNLDENASVRDTMDEL